MIKFRSWNYFLIHTPKHVIQFNFVDILPGGIICPSSLVYFEKENAQNTFKKLETLLDCPKFNKESLAIGDGIEVASKAVKMSVKKISKSSEDKELIYKISIQEEEANGLHLDLEFNINEYPS